MIAGLAALAHQGRLTLFRRLVQAGPQGQSCGELAKYAGNGITTTSAQLQVLANAQLVTSTRRGKSVIYSADYTHIGTLIGSLFSNCCAMTPDAACDLQRDIESAVQAAGKPI